ncbi:recombinase family protein [Fictibacillus sp. 5RED26]|uniref:recombinase family protein n=1 Tax=Fictibacillus sp. 5RED26 TaxID=2745876 RepID=UPI0018CD3FE2|nr:recombinase family protein [Fictibacillus sp. 5RED26]MBH0156158.1 recombinase family protein [Fictibacillus sp. 5RED26]
MEIKNVAMYLRISRDKGENIDTLQNHRERLIRVCEEKGYKYTIYEEIVSGQAELSDREALLKLLDELSLYDAVLVTGLDRLSRDLETAMHLWKRFNKAGIPVITPDRTYTDSDFMIYAMEGLVAHEEYSRITKKMRDNKRDVALQGNYVGSRHPLGFDKVKANNGRYTLKPNQDAEKVRKIFDLAINGYGAKRISEVVGIPQRSVKHMILNKAYIGTSIFKDVEVPDAFPAIVDKDTFYKANEAMKSRFAGSREQRTRTKGTVRTILKDLVYCGECGRKTLFQLKARMYNDKMVVKKCECGMRGAKEEIILEEFNRLMEDYTEELFYKIQSNTKPKINQNDLIKEEIQKIENEIAVLNKKFQKIKEAYTEEVFTLFEFKEEKLKHEEKVKFLTASQRQLEEKLDIPTFSDTKEGIQERISNLRKLNFDNKEDTNRILKTLIEKIYYKRVTEGFDEDGYFETDEIELIIEWK